MMPRRTLFGAAAVAAAVCLGLPSPRALAAEPALKDVLNAVVGLHVKVPETARSARTLGTERIGSGAVIDSEGLVLTIGYLVTEAQSIEIVLADGSTTTGRAIAYDHDTGFGLVRAERPIPAKPFRLGDSAALEVGAQVLAVSRGGPVPVTPARVLSRRPFAGYWEYLLDNAIFTGPPHAMFGGAALIGEDARLLGIGSLFVSDAMPAAGPVPGNMFVPVDLLGPILADMLAEGRPSRPPRPWLGVTVQEFQGRVVVARLAEDGPGAKGGLRPGDVIMGVDGHRVGGLIDFYRKTWALGGAGVTVPLDVLRLDRPNIEIERIEVASASRYDWLRPSPSR